MKSKVELYCMESLLKIKPKGPFEFSNSDDKKKFGKKPRIKKINKKIIKYLKLLNLYF